MAEQRLLAEVEPCCGRRFANITEVVGFFNDITEFSALAVEQGKTHHSVYLGMAMRIHPDKVGEALRAVAGDFFGRIGESCQNLSSAQTKAIKCPSSAATPPPKKKERSPGHYRKRLPPPGFLVCAHLRRTCRRDKLQEAGE